MRGHRRAASIRTRGPATDAVGERRAEVRAFCLEEARRCDEIVRRSLETPPLFGDGGRCRPI
jgi:hypothetical protein